MDKEKIICTLCQKEYLPHHNESFRTGLCGPCEDDVMYLEETLEYQENQGLMPVDIDFAVKVLEEMDK